MRELVWYSVRRSVVIACCIVACVSPLLAQVAAGELTGVVSDPAGAAVPGATITVTNVATNRQRVIVSTRNGVYTAASLPPGDYRIDIELTGFKSVRRDDILVA